MTIDTSKGHPAMDYREHERTYDGFLRFAKIGTGLVILIVAGMAIFLT